MHTPVKSMNATSTGTIARVAMMDVAEIELGVWRVQASKDHPKVKERREERVEV